MSTYEDWLAAEAPALLKKAVEVAFGHDGIVMAAEAGAAGSVDAIDGLGSRDRALVAAGCLAGVAGAIAWSEFPFEDRTTSLNRVDKLMEVARERGLKGREGIEVFGLLPPLTGGEVD